MLVFVVLLAVVLTAYAFTKGRSGAHVSGDLAADIGAALIRETGPVIVADSENAQLEVVAVTEWSKLSFVPGAVDLCGEACSPESAMRLVRVIRIAIGGSRKTIFVNLQPVLSSDPKHEDIFALSPDGATCLGRTLAGELSALKGEKERSDCYPPTQQTTLWRFAGL